MPDHPSVLAQMAAFPGLPRAGFATALVVPVAGHRPALRRTGRPAIVNGRGLTARGLGMPGPDAR
jgi:hypothetical protein